MNLEQKIIDKKFIGFKIKIDNGSIRKTFKSALKSTIVHNVVSLYLIQFANYIVPFIMIPYLARVLGPAGYGAVAFAHGFINYFMLFVDYGFNLSAARKISVYRDNTKVVNETTLHVWAAKGLLALLGFVMLMMLVNLLPKLNEIKLLLFALYGMVLGNVLFPTWLFQGMERMVVISIINLAMKIVVLIGVFLLIKRPEDVLIYAGLMGGGSVVAGFSSMLVAAWMFSIKITKISWRGIREVLREGWFIFISNMSVSLYTSANSFILGMVSDYSKVGYFSAGEKLIRVLISLDAPLMGALYPQACYYFFNRKSNYVRLVKSFMLISSSFGLILSLATFFLAPQLVLAFFGSDFAPSIPVVKILSFLPLVVFISHVTSAQILIPTGAEKVLFNILFVAGVINVVSGPIFAFIYGSIGMAFVNLSIECFITLMQLRAANKILRRII